jgi:hypothetical protein
MSATATAFAESSHGNLAGMSTRPRSQAGDPMTLGNMRANGARSVDVSCWECHHRAILSAAPWSDDVPVPSFGPRNGLHPMWHHRRGCPARLTRSDSATQRTSRISESWRDASAAAAATGMGQPAGTQCSPAGELPAGAAAVPGVSLMPPRRDFRPICAHRNGVRRGFERRCIPTELRKWSHGHEC